MSLEEVQSEKKGSCDEGNRGWSDVLGRREKGPRAKESERQQNLEKARSGLSLEPREEKQLC